MPYAIGRPRTVCPSAQRWEPPHVQRPRLPRGQALATCALVLASLVSGTACAPGELDEPREKYLRKQLDKHYPETAAGDTNAGDTNAGDTNAGDTNAGASTSEQETSAETQVVSSNSASPGSSNSGGPDSATASSGAATSGSASEATSASNELPPCVVDVFQTSCAGDACHYGGVFRFAPDFQSDDVFATLTTGTTGCASAPSPLYVDLQNPPDSYLLVKVKGEQASNCGTAMPADRTKISQEQITCLENWLDSL